MQVLLIVIIIFSAAFTIAGICFALLELADNEQRWWVWAIGAILCAGILAFACVAYERNYDNQDTTMASKSMKPARPQGGTPAPLTEAEKKEHALRVIGQTRNQIMQGIIFNAVQGKGDISEEKGVTIVETAAVMADKAVRLMFNIPDEEGSDAANE